MNIAPDQESIAELWKRYLASLGEMPETTGRTFTAWHFCDSKESADELAELVLAGTKRATAGSVAEYEAAGEEVPRAGDLSVVLDGSGLARCLIQTTGVELVPFGEVTAEFARTEGEGDGSLEYWRRVHLDYFTRTLAPHGITPTDQLLIACERFDVVFSPELEDPRALWDVKARAWDQQVGEAGDPNRLLNSDPVLWRLAGDVAGLDVLDAGCGTGYLSREMTRRGARVTGVDFSPAMIEIARQKASEQELSIQHFVADCAQLFAANTEGQLPEQGFDLAVSNYVLMDLADLDGAVASLYQALRPGGTAVLVLSHPCFPQGDTTTVDPDPRSPAVTYRWPHNYFEARASLQPAWGRFETAFPAFHRPLATYFQAFRKAGFTVTDLEEPRLTPDRAHLVEDERRRRRDQLLPFSIAFRLSR
jgi:uncharacterized protein YhfF/protein-L-isoaspartate O-methyltransferase